MSLMHLSTWVLLLAAGGPSERPFAIEVVDAETGRGVPLVELTTVHDVCLVTDSAGVAACLVPGLMGQKVFFHVKSHGYEFPADGFGYRGKTLATTPGGSARLEIKRVNVAQRLYRITGAGIYRDSVLVGRPAPIRQPLLNAQVLGSDSVVTAVWQDKIYWFWGDTNRPGHPLGNFKVPGATSALPDSRGLDPEVGVDLEYFVDRNGFAQKTIAAQDPGPTWISGLVVVPSDRMFAHYVNIESGGKGFKTYERGLVEFDDQEKKFHKVTTFPLDGPFPSGGHTLLDTDDGTEYVYYCDPFPQIRVPADPEKLARLDAYEAFTCLLPGGRLYPMEESRVESPEPKGIRRKALNPQPSTLNPPLDRRQDGSLRWAWKPNTDPVGPQDVAKLVRKGTIQPEENPWTLLDVESGKPIVAHRGSVSWNAYRKRWVMIACEVFGTSMLGETWYAEADRLTGPWAYARKIVTHNDYSFYNPTQHPFFDKEGGRVIFFEGTYTRTFSGNPLPTPRYDYNQIMYKLDLDDPRVNLPVPVYDLSDGGSTRRRFGTLSDPGADVADRPIAFWAFSPTRPAPDTLPVYQTWTEQRGGTLTVAAPPEQSAVRPVRPAFYALAPDAASPPPATVLLYEFRREADGLRAYATADQGESLPNDRRSARPIALVWPNPMRRLNVARQLPK